MATCIDIQDAVVARLATLGVHGVPVHGLLRGNMVSIVNGVVQQLGLCVEVLPALPTGINGNIAGPYVGELRFVVRVVEHPLLNKNALTRWDVMEQIICTLEGWEPPIAETQRCTMDSTVVEAVNGDLLELEITGSIAGPLTATALPTSLPALALEAVDSGVMKRGTADVPNGLTAASYVQISFAALGMAPFVAPPRVVLVTAIMPTGGPTYVASVIDGSIADDGFQVRFQAASGSAPVPTAGYRFAWLCLV